jgi:hypothetical protein
MKRARSFDAAERRRRVRQHARRLRVCGRERRIPAGGIATAQTSRHSDTARTNLQDLFRVPHEGPSLEITLGCGGALRAPQVQDLLSLGIGGGIVRVATQSAIGAEMTMGGIVAGRL